MLQNFAICSHTCHVFIKKFYCRGCINIYTYIYIFYQNDIHMFTNNIYNLKTIKIKETFLKKPNNIKTVP